MFHNLYPGSGILAIQKLKIYFFFINFLGRKASPSVVYDQLTLSLGLSEDWET